MKNKEKMAEIERNGLSKAEAQPDTDIQVWCIDRLKDGYPCDW